METKQCIKCSKIKEISEFPIRKYPNGNVSYRGECKQCAKIRQDKYQKEHQEEIKKWHAEYYQNNKEQLKIKNDEWWDKNREKMNKHRQEKRNQTTTPLPIFNNPEDIYKTWL